MRKFIVLMCSILLIALLTVTFVACMDNTGNKYTLELVDKDVEYFEFTVGEINWDDIEFFVYDSENNLLGSYTASLSMVASEDVEKLNTAGIKTVTLNFQGAELLVTFKLNSPVYKVEYSVTYNAGEGVFKNYEGRPNTIELKYDVIREIPTPVREGYEFLGWYEDVNATGTKIITPYELKRNLNLYAKWSDQRKYNVSYSIYEDGRKKQDLEPSYNVEYGKDIVLPTASNIVGYNFTRYEITNLDDAGAEIVYINSNEEIDEYVYNVKSNLQVILRYNIKMITLRFVSSSWVDGTTIENAINPSEPIVISGGIYSIQVPYGTILQKDILPVPTLPTKEGHDGKWIDDATGQEPVYSKATTDMFVTAKYDVRYYSMTFYDENNAVIENATRSIQFNSFLDKEPVVPEKVGHNGVWKVENKGYSNLYPIGEFIVHDLKSIPMKEDVKVFAFYEPKEFEIAFSYKMDGMSEAYVEKFTYKYGQTITAPIDLTIDREIEGVTYNGYDGKRYEVVWYSSPNLSKEKKVTFPVDVVDNATFYYQVVRRPFIVDFRLDESQELENVHIESVRYDDVKVEIKDGVAQGVIVPPTWIMEGYEIVAWEYKAYAPEFDETVLYATGDYVFYNGKYYSTLQPARGILPTNPSYWIEGARTLSYPIETAKNGITIYDFHEYSEDLFYDRAFYANIRVKQFDVTFKNLVITQNAGEYAYNYETVGLPIPVNYATTDISHIAPTALATPTYPDLQASKFIFEGWYTESEFVTLPVDLTTLKITEDVILYAKWSDELIGTEGLIFEADDENNPTSYSVVGFESNVAEYSHLVLRVPDTYKGLPVVSIADNAFAGFDKVLYVDEIVLPVNLASIGDNAFTACYSLGKFTIADLNASFKVDSYGVLYSKDGKTLYKVPAKAEGVKNLVSYTVPSSVEVIKGGAFAGLKNLENVVFEGGQENANVITIGDYAFDGCVALASITLPNSLENIGNYAFRTCYSLTEVNVDNNNSRLIKVGEGAFIDSLDALRVADECILLGNVLIAYLGDANELEIADYVVSIADGAFNKGITDSNASNYQLTKLTISENSSLKYIGNKVFLSCSSLHQIVILTATKVEIESDSFNGIALYATLYVNNSLVDEYQNDTSYDFFGDSFILGA